MTVQVPDDLHRRLKYLAVDDDTTMQKIFLEAVKLYLQQASDVDTESAD